MNLFLILAFLFFIGSTAGWCIELIFRRFFSSANPERKWINPGFCTGPYVPLYGFGLCILYLISSVPFELFESPVLNKLFQLIAMALAMTAIEYIAGIAALKFSHVRLWDYSGEWGNIQGIICPKFSLAWAVFGAAYHFFVHLHILDALNWLSRNLAFSFVIGMFFGVFVIDVINSSQIIMRLKKFADENDVVVRYESIKLQIRNAHDKNAVKYHFFAPFRSERPLHEHLTEMRTSFETRAKEKIQRVKK